MKLISVSFTGFGAYPNKVQIDLKQISRDGLFLICGDTGAGKTTLLDAMCYALYNTSSSGSSSDPGKGKFESMRSRFITENDKTTNTEVELILQKNGELYRFHRMLKPKKRAAGFDEVHEYLQWDGKVWSQIEANLTSTKVTEAAVRLTGLTADQFRQIIILPQGRFEQLLTSDSAQKEDILSTIFAAERWQEAVNYLNRIVHDEENALRQEKNQLQYELNKVGCADLAALSSLIQTTEEAFPAVQEQAEKAEADFQHRTEQQKGSQALEQQFIELEQRALQLQTLKQQESVFAEKENALDSARAAENLRPALTEINRIRTEVQKALTDEKKYKEELENARQASSQKQEEWKAHDEKRPLYQQALIRIPQMEQALAVYQAYTRHLSEEKAARERLDLASRDLEETVAQCKLALQQAKQAEKASLNQHQIFIAIQRAYRAGAAGRLAKDLSEGSPCPVCGSIHHPAPAILSQEHITDAQLDKAQRDEEKARELEKRAQKTAQLQLKAYQAAEQEYTKATEAVAGIIKLLEADRLMLLEGISNEQELLHTIDKNKKAVARYEDLENTLKPSLEEKKSFYHQAEGTAAQAKQLAQDKQAELRDQESKWNQLLISSGYKAEEELINQLKDSQQIESLRAAIEEYRAKCRHAQEEYKNQEASLQNKERPDMVLLNDLLEEAIAQRDNCLAHLNETKQKLNEYHELQTQLTDRIQKLEKKESVWSKRNEFCKQLDNRNGLNLHRYVLAAMLDSVVTQANYLLIHVHNGRYQLKRSDTATGRKVKAGLELNVLDSMTNCERSVKSLSGGQKFLVSLALAIGLNSVMQAQTHGVRIEAIFVDEGFGSLDESSVEDAMQMLQTVRRSHGMVGVISHIESLRTEIPVHIEVHKDTVHGSTLTCC